MKKYCVKRKCKSVDTSVTTRYNTLKDENTKCQSNVKRNTKNAKRKGMKATNGLLSSKTTVTKENNSKISKKLPQYGIVDKKDTILVQTPVPTRIIRESTDDLIDKHELGDETPYIPLIYTDAPVRKSSCNTTTVKGNFSCSIAADKQHFNSMHDAFSVTYDDLSDDDYKSATDANALKFFMTPQRNSKNSLFTRCSLTENNSTPYAPWSNRHRYSQVDYGPVIKFDGITTQIPPHNIFDMEGDLSTNNA